MMVIIDYNIGNLGSILNMLKKVGATAIISSDISEIEKADKLILPGVGSFDYGMEQIEKTGLIELLNEKVLDKKTPVLGICLGAQLLACNSEEGQKKGLGWIDMEVIKFNKDKIAPELKIPHMGWNEVKIKRESPLFRDVYDEPRYYFVHSYHFMPKNSNDILTTSLYGYEFVSAIEKDNIVGVQFHPEKSHKFGMRILKNFAELY